MRQPGTVKVRVAQLGTTQIGVTVRYAAQITAVKT